MTIQSNINFHHYILISLDYINKFYYMFDQLSIVQLYLSQLLDLDPYIMGYYSRNAKMDRYKFVQESNKNRQDNYVR